MHPTCAAVRLELGEPGVLAGDQQVACGQRNEALHRVLSSSQRAPRAGTGIAPGKNGDTVSRLVTTRREQCPAIPRPGNIAEVAVVDAV